MNIERCVKQPYLLFKSCILIVAALMLAACQSSSDHAPRTLEVIDEIQTALEESGAVDVSEIEGESGPPEDVMMALVPGLSLNAEVQEVEERFDISIREPLDVHDFFGQLTEGTDYSVGIHPDVEGEISSLLLRNVTVEEAMDQVASIYGLGINKSGNVYQITPGGSQTRFFKVNYLNVSRSGSSTMSVSGGNSSSGGSVGGGARGVSGTGGVAAGGTGSGGVGGAGGGGGGGASVSTTSDADFWADLEETVTEIINSGTNSGGLLGGIVQAKRSVNVFPQTGMVVVTALPAELAKVEEFLSLSQASLQRQVVLEAKILEVELKESFQAGIDISALTRVRSNNELTADFSFLESAVSSVSSPLTLAYGSTDFNSVIKLLESQGNVQVISSPRMTTLNNQKAVFKVGDEQFFLTQSNTTSFGAGDQQNTTQNANLQPFFSGIALDVTPFISEKGEIFLHIHPLLNQVKEDLKSIGGNELPLANSVTRESDSIALARNGEVVVISGLMQARSTGSNAGVPGAKDIPVVGNAFQQRQNEIVKTELVILLRAIVDEGDVMQQIIQERNESVEKLRKRLDPYYR